MKRVLAAVAVACAVAPVAAAAPAPVMRASVSSQGVLFADDIAAQVDIAVAGQTPVRFDVGPSAWSVDARSTTTLTAGDVRVHRLRLELACRSTACVGRAGARTVPLPAVTATVASARMRARWPTVTVASRLPAGAASTSPPPFRLQTSPPPLRTSMSASLLAALLDAAAAACAAAAAVLAAHRLRMRRRAAALGPQPLERALTLVREAERRPVADRRRALALLARVAPSAEAAVAAWSRAAPTPEEMESVARRVEETV
jgi:hypothetical protein